MRAIATGVSAVGLSVATLLTLGGCFLLPHGTPSTASPTPTPSESATPEPASDELFTVTATTTDSAGAPVTLTLTAHRPQESTTIGRESIRDQYITGCNALGGGSSSDSAVTTLSPEILAGFNSELMVIDVVSEPAGRTFASPISLLLGSGFYYQVTSGDNVENLTSLGCYPGSQLTGTGTVTGITNYESPGATPDPTQWLSGTYGFGVDATAQSLQNCTVQLTDLATADGVDSAEGWDTAQTSNSYCSIGYLGE